MGPRSSSSRKLTGRSVASSHVCNIQALYIVCERAAKEEFFELALLRLFFYFADRCRCTCRILFWGHRLLARVQTHKSIESNGERRRARDGLSPDIRYTTCMRGYVSLHLLIGGCGILGQPVSLEHGHFLALLRRLHQLAGACVLPLHRYGHSQVSEQSGTDSAFQRAAGSCARFCTAPRARAREPGGREYYRLQSLQRPWRFVRWQR